HGNTRACISVLTVASKADRLPLSLRSTGDLLRCSWRASSPYRTATHPKGTTFLHITTRSRGGILVLHLFPPPCQTVPCAIPPHAGGTPFFRLSPCSLRSVTLG